MGYANCYEKNQELAYNNLYMYDGFKGFYPIGKSKNDNYKRSRSLANQKYVDSLNEAMRKRNKRK